jgi:carbonic anhydrase
MDSYQTLLLNNKAWVAEKLSVHKDYFKRMANDQTPEFLWIGCSDSRVPAEEVTGTEPGEIFVHRNIANQVIHTDFNMLSVLQYAVEVLQVKHVIVCGHYNCGGVRNALSHNHLGLINKWLRHIKDVYRFHQVELNNITSDEERFKRLVELNVIEQVRNLSSTSIIQKHWANFKMPTIHGWVYDIHTGHLKDIATMTYQSPIEDIYRFDFIAEKKFDFSEDL